MATRTEHHKPIYQQLYVQVLAAIVVGAVLGYVNPGLGAAMKPFGDAFIKLVRMMITPIVFTAVVVGIAKMGDLKEVGRVGLKALIYFQVLTGIALAIGLVVGNLLKPGLGMNADPNAINPQSVAQFTSGAQHLDAIDFLLNIIPNTVVDAFARGEILPVLLFSILFGLALARFGEKGRPLLEIIDQLSHTLFDIIGLIMKLAPIGAFGGMAYAIGQFGLGTLLSLGKLMLCFYLTSFLFIVAVLGVVAYLNGYSLWRLFKYVKEEFLIVLGTSSIEPVLPRMLVKLENLGCARPVVGMVLPAGYSFNLDGIMIYLTMSSVFLAQAFNIDLSLGQQLSLLAILWLTSKGVGAVPGAGFVVLAAALPSVGTIPVVGLALLLGVDRFMSECRAITSFMGNVVATIAIARWERAVDMPRLRAHLAGETEEEAEEPEKVADAEAVFALRASEPAPVVGGVADAREPEPALGRADAQ
ncbi:MAG TPA: C4-dicarboxylate transporter DctA [Geodermatophilus sp.]|nr:C4-dicarboxylate transporter DctA [Geodermatophilus sp.]